MKKNVFTFLACLLIANTINAQGTDSDSRDNIHIGIKAGANYSNIYDSEGEEYEADGKIGFAGGLFLSLPLGKYVGIQPEVLFSQKGFKATSSVLGSDVGLTRTTNYIDIPIFLAIKPSRMLTLLVGPQYSYLIKQKDVFTNPITDVEVTQDFEADDIRKNTLCMVGGIDITLSSIVIGARVGMDLYNNNGDGTSTTPRYKNAWAQATVGFRF
ncbi:MAG: PorT family protein [Porphyromonadaceae bacterium]|nr:outer membrane beta-barrel protein [uncultured Macellibacteroides sp.]MCE5224657.1 PorT family protein [Porphyromonadaceae bacterium]